MLEKDLSYLAALFDQAAKGLLEAQEAQQQSAEGKDAAQQPLKELALPAAKLEAPRQASHGDFACNMALQWAKALRAKPRDLAEQLCASVLCADREALGLIESAEVAGPGFINLRLSLKAKQAVLETMLREKDQFGVSATQNLGKVLVEFVSANPTGPLHVGHGRQAALGDAICRLLEATGYQVQREFYYNDAGAQIEHLARSVQARLMGISPDDEAFPADGYRGDYILDIAKAYREGQTVSARQSQPVTGKGEVQDLDSIRQFAVTYLRHEQDLDLQAFGLQFDVYFLESSLYGEGAVRAVIERLQEQGHCYELDEALWLRTSSFGDDKDRVMRKRDGSYTYFVPDVAYHRNKWMRGFVRAINIQGADHHGTVARVRAGLQALDEGIEQGYPDYILHKMVTVMKGGQEVKISKRAGSYVSLRDLMEWSGDGDLQRGRDAVRFFLISRRADSEFQFDIDLALSKSDENPVYYVQYAHARICSVLRQAQQQFGWTFAQAQALTAHHPGMTRLHSDRELALLALLARWPGQVREAAEQLAPHAIAYFLRELASAFHAWYNADRFLVEDDSLREARLMLLACVAQVLRKGLGLLGVSAPESM